MKTTASILLIGLILGCGSTSIIAASPDANIPKTFCSVAGGHYLTFDGVDDYVNLGNPATLQISGDLTVSAWVRLDPNTTGRLMGIVGKLEDRRGFVLWRDGQNKFAFLLGDGHRYEFLAGVETATDDKWHHLTGIVRSGTAYLYVDGQLVASGGSGLTVRDSGKAGAVGRLFSTSNGYNLHGAVDDVRFYDRHITEQELVTIMESPPGPNEPGLKGYWDFNEGQGQSAADQSGFGHLGILGGSVEVDASDPNWASTSNLCIFERTYYVNANTGDDNNGGFTPDDPFASLRRGINASRDGDTIMVAPGYYLGSDNRNLDLEGRAIVLQSEKGPAETIIDCNQVDRAFYFHSGEQTETVIDGFTIKNGQAPTLHGGGIYCNGSTPTIRHCIITQCSAIFGGGFGAENTGPITLHDCQVLDNDGFNGGGLYFSNAPVQLLNCIVARNVAASAGGGLYYDTGEDQPGLLNCTVASNVASSQGGGLLANRATVPIKNSIFWGNQANMNGPEMTVLDQGHVIVSYSNVQGGTESISTQGSGVKSWDVGNLNEDPLFVDPNDYHLASERGRYWPVHNLWVIDEQSSPCIDKGDPNDDAVLEPSPNGNRVNMGAYGATAYASRTSADGDICTLFGDLDDNGIIDGDDLLALIAMWLDENQP